MQLEATRMGSLPCVCALQLIEPRLDESCCVVPTCTLATHYAQSNLHDQRSKMDGRNLKLEV